MSLGDASLHIDFPSISYIENGEKTGNYYFSEKIFFLLIYYLFI
jgi:hypothetical protein